MPKAYSILLIGTGIFLVWLHTFGYLIIGISEGIEGFPTVQEMFSLATDLSLENMKENPTPLTALMMIGFGLIGTGVGIVVLTSGGIILLYEKLKGIKSYSIKHKPVSLSWQIVCSFIPGFDLWALFRIKKLRIGMIVYAIQFSGSLLSIYSIIPQIDLSNLASIGLMLMFTVFVYLWSRDWNKTLKTKRISEGTTIFTG